MITGTIIGMLIIGFVIGIIDLSEGF